MTKVNNNPDDVLRQTKGTMYEGLDLAMQFVHSNYITEEEGTLPFSNTLVFSD